MCWNRFFFFSYKTHTSQGDETVGRVEEILVLRSCNQLLGVLLCRCKVDTEARAPYYLPHCMYERGPNDERQYTLIPFEVSAYLYCLPS